MATSLTQQAVSARETPYQVNPAQIVKASTALSKHIATTRTQQQAESGKRDLLNDTDDEADGDDATEPQAGDEDGALWLVVATKKCVADQARLKAYKILTTIYSPVPHSLHQASHTSICLITADPQRRYKDLVADDQFPASLRPLVTRVLGVSKLKAKFKSFESRRQLAAEHTHFFVDERVITAMPFLLGKAFYKSSAKRPIPVRLTGHANRRVDKELAAKAKKDRRAAGNKESALFGTPAEIGREIEKALSSALVNLAVSTSTAVRVGFASWAPERVSENVEAVVKGMLEPREDGAAVKIVPGGWRNVRSIYLKGTKTTALPLWLADELWTDEADVVEHQKEEGETTTTSKKRKPVDGAETVAPSSSAKKSKVAAAPAVVTEETKEKENKPAVTEKKEKTEKKQSAAAKAKAALESDVAARKEKIKAQRNKAMRKLIK